MSDATAERQDEQTHYDTIGVGHDVTPEDLKKVYRHLARELHPDVNPSPEAEQRFKEISEAYAVLSDPTRREEYDQSLLEPDEPEPEEPQEFHDEWGDEATWEVPEDAATDDAPTDPPGPDASVDEWGEVILDDAVVVEDEPRPAPAGDTTPADQNKHRTSWVRAKDSDQPGGLQWPGGEYPQPVFVHPSRIIPKVLAVGGVALLVILALALLTGAGPKQADTPVLRLAVVGVGLIIGFIAGAAVSPSTAPPKPRKGRKGRKPKPEAESKPRTRSPPGSWP